jgi:hypothetical protein
MRHLKRENVSPVANERVCIEESRGAADTIEWAAGHPINIL